VNRRKTHLAWGAFPDVLCEQKFPKPQRTAEPREVTCCSCKRVAAHKPRTTHRSIVPPVDFVPTRARARLPLLGTRVTSGGYQP